MISMERIEDSLTICKILRSFCHFIQILTFSAVYAVPCSQASILPSPRGTPPGGRGAESARIRAAPRIPPPHAAFPSAAC